MPPLTARWGLLLAKIPFTLLQLVLLTSNPSFALLGVAGLTYSRLPFVSMGVELLPAAFVCP